MMSPSPTKMILVTGATGQQGRAVISGLLANAKSSEPNLTIIAVTRNPSSTGAQTLVSKSNVHVIAGDLSNPDAIFEDATKAVAAPVWGLYYVQVNSDTEETQGKALVDAAVREQMGAKPLKFIATADIGWFAAQSFLFPESETYRNKALPLVGVDLTQGEADEVFEKIMVPEKNADKGMPMAPCLIGSAVKWVKGDAVGDPFACVGLLIPLPSVPTTEHRARGQLNVSQRLHRIAISKQPMPHLRLFRLKQRAMDAPRTPEESEESVTARLGAFLEEELTKGKLKLEKSLGLGQTPNVIPSGEVEIRGDPRPVEIGWHPVAGLAGKWFAEQTGLGKMITDGIRKFPDPTQHWAVLVGDYCHQLWMLTVAHKDENLDVIYTNGKIDRDEWHTFEVGKSRFNDVALKEAGDMTIFAMREKRPAYNLINNNCQTFALRLLDAIQVGKHREFATSFEVYQRAIGAGSIKDLFADDHPDDHPEERPSTPPQGTVPLAQQVMDEKTTQLDSHETLHS
ncbi:hypothetical protein SCUP515_11866 [Seiridium cupressi]